jgi:hypothetical protein
MVLYFAWLHGLVVGLVGRLFSQFFGGSVGFWDSGSVGGLVCWLVGGFQPRRDYDGTGLANLPLQRNPVTILQEDGWAPGAE